MTQQLWQLLSSIKSLAIAKQLETFRCRDITVGGVKPGEIVLRRRLMIDNIIMGQVKLTHEGEVFTTRLNVRVNKNHDRVIEGVGKVYS